MIQRASLGEGVRVMSIFDNDDGRHDDGRDDGGCNDNGGSGQSKGSRPLYLFVRDALYERIRSGAWTQGQLIPNEFDIAHEFGVSQGTARRALNLMAEAGLLARRQGSGTYVTKDTPSARFFSILDKRNIPIVPESRDIICVAARANDQERAALELEKPGRVIRISRTRTHNGTPLIAEKISLPESLFPGLDRDKQIPNTLYDYFQKSFKVLVMTAHDRLDAVAADARAAEALDVAVGAPLFRIDRISYALEDRPIEWRVSLCHLKDAYYLARTKWPVAAAS